MNFKLKRTVQGLLIYNQDIFALMDSNALRHESRIKYFVSFNFKRQRITCLVFTYRLDTFVVGAEV